MAIVCSEGLQVFIRDIYGNLLLEFISPEPIIQMKSSRTSKDSFIALLTTDEHLLVYDIEFARRKNETSVKLVDEIYSSTYKSQFNNYKYKIKPSFHKENKDKPGV